MDKSQIFKFYLLQDYIRLEKLDLMRKKSVAGYVITPFKSKRKRRYLKTLISP